MPQGLQVLQVSSAMKNAPLQRTLIKQLKGYKIQVLSDSHHQQALDAQVFIQSEKLDRRLLSLFSTGQVAEYELVYTINYYIQFAGQDALPMEFDITREYQDDPDAVLAKSRERDLVLSEMRQQAANRIIRQLANSYSNWQLTKGQ
ncbi:LPS assembly lipoprotein LptE [Paraglaciecola sp.]|uniref:LPS-assembly lipoprotein LptE n=1 Tax=Paraglaciecola sp. TaxID=1920173 RepID=UPI003EF2DC0F